MPPDPQAPGSPYLGHPLQVPTDPVGPASPAASGPSFLPFLRRSASSEDPRDVTPKEAPLPGLPAEAAPHPAPDSGSSPHSGFGRLPRLGLAALEEAGLRERLLQDQPIERFSRPDRLADWSKAGAVGKRVPVQPRAGAPSVPYQPVGAGRRGLREGPGVLPLQIWGGAQRPSPHCPAAGHPRRVGTWPHLVPALASEGLSSNTHPRHLLPVPSDLYSVSPLQAQFPLQ